MSFENLSCQGRIENFFRGGAPNFVTFFKRSCFPAELIVRNLSKKKTLGESGSMLPRKIFENLHTVAIIMFFEQFSGKVCAYF